MLEMQQFCITQTEGQAEPLGYVGEHLAKTLEIKSDTGLDWVYRLEVIIGNDACRIDGLVYDSGMLRLPLTSALLRAPGLYTAQVVGTHGEVVRKSNLFFLRVHPSVSADRDLPPEEPTLFQQQLAQMSALAGQVQSSTAAAETAGKQARKAAEDARQSAEQTAEALKEWEEFVADQGSIPVEDEVARAWVEDLRIRVEKLEENPGTDHNLERRVANLEAAANGYLYREETDSTEAYTKTVPPGALPWATLDSFGGRSIRWNQAFNGAERPGSYNQTRLNRIENGDGSFTYELLSIDKSSSGTYTHTCRIRNIEVVPGNVYGHFYWVKVSRNSKVAVGTSTWTESVAVPADGEFHRVGFVATRTSSTDFFMGFTYGQQGELEIGDSFTIRDWMYFDLTEMFGAGNEPTREQFDAMFPDDYYPYAPGETKKAEITSVVSSAGSSIPIPETIRSLPGYGETGSLVDFTNGRYTAPDGTETDISTLLPDNALEVEAGGTVTFANENRLPVHSRVSYLLKVRGE